MPPDFEEDSEEELRSEFKRDLMPHGRDPFDDADAEDAGIAGGRSEGGRAGARAGARGAGAGGAGSSPQKDDLRVLQATLSREGGERGSSGRWLEFHEIMDRIVEEEEQLLNGHMKQIQDNADDLTQEGALLSKVQGNEVVDYDIDGYAA